MKIIKLYANAANVPHYAYYRGDDGVDAMLFGDLDAITCDPLILISKEDFEKLLANQEGKADLPVGSKVMVSDGSKDDGWWLATYLGGKCIRMVGEYKPAIVGDGHIIPFDIFDPCDPEKWNGTENDYGMKGGALVWAKKTTKENEKR